ncbi:uncharacterized protein LOC128853512 [Cuculus canorus]|uniref:uncharacterized protein LOC128853512 n=1 Tax=Cuculus canorus TaxID=55661 RepID=UPI0023AA4483|nr:uncharacterized protein LOC128853512 [Cuculus canorus]
MLGRAQPLQSCPLALELAGGRGKAAGACGPAAGAVHWGKPLHQTKHSGKCWSACSPRQWPRASAMSAQELEEELCSSHEPGQVLAELSAALENADIKSLEWSQDGRDVVVDIELYDEEMRKNKELFPELADLGSAAALQVWLQGYGFKVTGTKVKLQHLDFQRPHPTAEQPSALRGNADTSDTQQKKKKRKIPARCRRPQEESMAKKMLRQYPRLRPLYEYRNFDMPELMHPSAEEQVPEVAQPNEVPAGPEIATTPQPQGTQTSSALEILDSAASNTLVPIDIDEMMRCAAHQMPAFFPWYE